MGQDAQGWSSCPNHHGAFDPQVGQFYNGPQKNFYAHDMIYPPEF